MRRISWQLGAVFVLLFAFLAAGALVAIQPAGAQAPGAELSSAPRPSAQQANGGKPKVQGSSNLPLKAPPVNAPDVVLYDQLNNAATTSTSSQQFEPAFATFNDQVADDFPVPAGQQWSVQEVDIGGVYYNGAGPATAFNVYFYNSVVSGTYSIPSTPVYTATNQSYSHAVTGTFAITLSVPALLTAGSYFVSAQAVQNFTPNGQFGWTDRTVGATSPSAFRNPGGGLVPACAAWDRRSFCVPSSIGPDQVFRLVGNVVTAPTNTPGGAATPTRTVSPTRTATPGCATNYTVAAGTATLVPGTVDVGNHCDDCVTSGITLPFAYTLYDQSYTAVNADSNGTLQFASATSNFTPACLPGASFNFAIFAYWVDQCTGPCGTSTCTSCGIFTSTSGSAPNRIFNIEWRTNYYNTNTPVNYEVRLYEGQTHFDVVYGTIPSSASSKTLGVQRDTGSLFTQFQCGTGTPANGTLLRYQSSSCASPTRTATASPTTTPTECPLNFSDVPPSHPFYDYVRCLYCRGGISGYGDGTFRPYNNTTRGQLAKIVVLSYAIPLYTPPTATFRDVPATDPFYQFIETAYHSSLISGYACGSPGEPCPGLYFRPVNLVTRGQVSKIVVVAAGWFLINPTMATFNDVPVGSPFFQYVETAYCHQIISGYACGGPGEPCPGLYFRPGNNATRAQIAKIVCLAVRNAGMCITSQTGPAPLSNKR